MLFGTDNEGWTVWYWAAERGHLESLKKLWDWAKENLTREEIYNKFLFGTGNWNPTAWYWAANRHHSKKLEKLWESSKKKLTI